MSNYTVSIVIPNYKRPELLTKLLDSLVKAQWPDDFTDIIVVENGDKAINESVVVKYLDKLPIKYLYIEETGASPARNHGINQSTSDIIIFFDDDIVVSEKSLLAYNCAFKKHGVDYFYGGKLEADYEEKPQSWLLELLPDSAKGFALKVENSVLKDEYLLGGNLAIPKKLLNKAGLFDPYCPTGESNSGFGGEETRLQKRLNDLGYSGIYINDAVVKHFVPKSRCSKKWLLHRRYRQGIGFAISEREKKEISKPPAWIILKIVKLYLKLALQTIKNKSEEDKLKTSLSIKYYKGMITGYSEKLSQ